MSEPDFGLFLPLEKLPAFGENTARRFRSTGARPEGNAARRVLSALSALRRAAGVLSRRYPDTAEAPEGVRWLLDNRYLAEREGRGAVSDLRAAPRDRRRDGAVPLLEACGALTRCGGGRVTEERAEAFFSGFQRVLPLSRTEVTLLGAGLRGALLLELSAACRSGAPDAARAAALFTSLRLFSTLDLSPLLLRVDLAEQVLLRDPAGVYPRMDERTRELYRRRATELARREGIPEKALCERVLALSEAAEGDGRHVGWWLFVRPLGAAPRRRAGGAAYLAANVLLTLGLSLWGGFAAGSAPIAALLLLPVSELVKQLTDFAVLRAVRPRLIPRLDLPAGVPDAGRTVCVVSALLTSPEAGPAMARRLEEFRMCSRDCGPNLLFGILADLPEADGKTAEGDGPALEAAADAVRALNRTCGGGFYLFCRRRTLDARNGRWLGRERKRGALLALARLLTGESGELTILAGDGAALAGTRYILTLDADTRLTPGAAAELIGGMLHPLNRPVFDEGLGRVVSGYGLIHPRMVCALSDASATPFSRLFSGGGGTDPYGSACGEVCMDLFGRGGFAGKGILDARMLLRCAGSVPAGRILSHDAVEGALLRGGYMSDTQLTDGFPAAPASFRRRLERWTRGDWQNLTFLLRRGRTLTPADRWRLFDSLRRSLTAPAALLSLLSWALLPGPGTALAAAAAGLCLLSGTAAALLSALLPPRFRRVRLYSDAPHGARGALLAALARGALLPAEAFTCASAAGRALWRTYVSGKKLLEWQTAAQSETAGRGGVREALPALLCGVMTIALSPAPGGKALGAAWLLSPLLERALGAPGRQREPVSPAAREYLTARAAELWRYFTVFCRKSDHYLPPDNWQEQPPVGRARRTSPTNIGLALVSCLAALDLGLAKPEEALELAARLLSSAEALPKWRGNLYNWYDTASLRVLEPAYVSSVDSGNFCACLLAAREGFREYGAPELAARADALLRGTDLTPLYDPRRRLFRIGWDVCADRPSEGWYDLLASEALLTSYLAVARGEAPRRHWRALSRALVRDHGRQGMASWTGTMFEYLMPALFLPYAPNSLLWESARFCVGVQRRRVRGGMPWGESESAFFALSPDLSYRYKAHGCAALALKRGMDAELVVSPYSSFLALDTDTERALANLKRLEALGALGPFGFWEAVDFTPSRCRDGEQGLVRCVMAHHLGMSLLAVDNLLCRGAVRRRFMAAPETAAFRGLIEERVPTDAAVLRLRGAEPPEKPGRGSGGGWEKRGTDVDFAAPECCLLSNGVYNIMLTESGLSSASAGGVGIYALPRRRLSAQGGFLLWLETEAGRFPLLPSSEDGGAGFSWAFSGDHALYECRRAELKSRVSVCVSARDTGEARLVELSAPRETRGVLWAEFTPMLAGTNDYVNHPAFWRLGLRASLRAGALLLRRLPRGDAPGAWLCLACDRPMTVSANDGGEPLGWLSHPRVRASVQVALRAGGGESVRLALAFGGDADEVCAAAQRLLTLGRTGAADMGASAAGALGLDRSDAPEAMGLVGPLLFPHPSGDVTEGREALWRLGISGDLPILCVRARDASQAAGCAALVRRCALLRLCGLRCDLVFLTDEGGDYRRPLYRAVTEAAAAAGLPTAPGSAGGVHVAAVSEGEPAERAAALYLPPEGRRERPPRTPGRPCLPPAPPRRGGDVETRWLSDGTFEFYVNQFVPRRVWCDVLAGERFGYLAADAGVGNMWYRNARECRVTPWLCDDRAASGPETLETLTDGRRVSLFAAEDGFPCRVRFGFGWAQWEKELPGGTVRVTAFVPRKEPLRALLIEGARERVFWRAELALCGELRDAPFVVTDYVNHMFSARSSRSPWPDEPFRAVFSAPPAGYTGDLDAWLRGETDGRTGAGLTPCFAAVLPAAETAVIVCGCAPEETLRALTDPERARAALAETRKDWAALTGRLRVRTPCAALDRYLNGWCVYQAAACRLLGRTSLYQSGGAYGFRDQLQDAVNLLPVAPGLARERILDCCAHQYREGDVMHWWHPPFHGVRTRCSDDLLWLSWAICEYEDATGDRALLEETRPFLVSPPLGEGERSRYETPVPSPEAESVLAHGARALNAALARGFGAHGLPLLGSGDWNDGLDAAGAQGRGESVWLGWFLAHTARRYAEVLAGAGRREDAAALLSAARRCGAAADRAWDGAWYLRGWHDDGLPLGSASSPGGKLDSVAQSWACFCRESSPERRSAALTAALSELFDRRGGVVRLLKPPYESGEPEVGYIASYGPGFRENGGQYTHGAVWLAMACLREGRTDDGFALLRALAEHDGGTEPFVLPADAAAAPERYGEDGWSWYTGSAGWFFRACVEELLGISLKDGKLSVSPRPLPAGWDGWEAVWTDGTGREHPIRAEGQKIWADGVEIHNSSMNPGPQVV